MRFRVLLLSWAAVAWSAPAHAAQRQPPADVFPAGVELVTVDAVVTDSDGRPVSGLTRDDFVIEEDGRSQALETFEALARAGSGSSPVAVAAPVPRVSSNAAPPGRRERTFVVVFDDLNLTLATAARARVAIERFFTSGLRDGDRVLLVATGGDAWWSARWPAGRDDLLAALARLRGRFVPAPPTERLTAYEAFKIHVYRDREVAARVGRRLEAYGTLVPEQGQRTQINEYRFNFEDPHLLARAAEVYEQSLARERATLGVLARASAALGAQRGRKALLLVSEGFIHDPSVSELKRVGEAARRANVALYFLDARGLEGLPASLDVEIDSPLEGFDYGAQFRDAQLESEGAELLAAESGGFSVKNTNDLGRGFERIGDESDSYYLLGYRPTNGDLDGRFRRIEVRVRRPGVKVRARKGYYARAKGESDAAVPDGELQRALDAPFDLDGVPLRAAAFTFDDTPAGTARVIVAAEIDTRDLALREQGGRLAGELQVLWIVARRDSGEFTRHDQKVELTLKPEAREQLAREGYALTHEFALTAGAYQARLVVRDARSGRTGSVTHAFEVPAPGQLRVSTPILGDALASAGGASHPVLRLRRAYAPGATLHAEFQVYGVQRDAVTGQPRVFTGFELRRDDGGAVGRGEPRALVPGAGGRLSQLVSIPLASLAPGTYELVFYLHDGVAARDAQYREAFDVAGPRP